MTSRTHIVPRQSIPWRVAAFGLISAMLLLPSCQTTKPADMATDFTKPQAAVNHTLNAFHAAAANADFDAYFANWSDRSVFLGTDATERWEGQAFKAFAKPHFDKGQGWTYLSRDRHISFSPDGNTAWFDELLDHDKYGVCRGSGVLLRNDAGWTIAQYHLSFPVPNDLAAELTSRIKAVKPKP